MKKKEFNSITEVLDEYLPELAKKVKAGEVCPICLREMSKEIDFKDLNEYLRRKQELEKRHSKSNIRFGSSTCN